MADVNGNEGGGRQRCLEALLTPRSVALIGASTKPGSVGLTHELIVGMSVDATFGPLILFGA